VGESCKPVVQDTSPLQRMDEQTVDVVPFARMVGAPDSSARECSSVHRLALATGSRGHAPCDYEDQSVR
jgi:hypothetical protein